MKQKLMEVMNIISEKTNAGLRGTVLVFHAFSDTGRRDSAESGRVKSELSARRFNSLDAK